MKVKSKVVQARLDMETSRLIEELTVVLDCTESQVIREALQLLASCTPSTRRRRMVGVGKFASGVRDLGSNKGHLRGFGK